MELKNEDENESYSTRLTILKPDEIKLIYDRPIFTNEDREIYFDLSHEEKNALNKLRTLNSKINFILQIGYFKFKYRFFAFKLSEIQEDLKFVVEIHFNNKNLNIKKIDDVSRITATENKNIILGIFKYRDFDKIDIVKIEEKASLLVKISAKQKYIFHELYNFLEDKRIITPKYSVMQDLISKVLIAEEERLVEITEKYIEKEFFLMI